MGFLPNNLNRLIIPGRKMCMEKGHKKPLKTKFPSNCILNEIRWNFNNMGYFF